MSSLEFTCNEEDSAVKLLPLVHFLADTLQTRWSLRESTQESNVVDELCNALVNRKHINTVDANYTSNNFVELEQPNGFYITLPLQPPRTSSSSLKSLGSSRVSHIIDELLSNIDYCNNEKRNANFYVCNVHNSNKINIANANAHSKQTSSAFHRVWLPLLERWYQQHEKHNLENANRIKDSNDSWFTDDLRGRIYMDYLENCIESKLIANCLQNITHKDIHADRIKTDCDAQMPISHSEEQSIELKTNNDPTKAHKEEVLSLSMQNLFSLCSVTENFQLLAKTVWLTLLLHINKLLHCTRNDKSVVLEYVYKNYVSTELEEFENLITPTHVTSECLLREIELYGSYLYEQMQDIRLRETAIQIFNTLTACNDTETNSQVDDKYENYNKTYSVDDSDNSDDDSDDSLGNNKNYKVNNLETMNEREISDGCWLYIMSLLVEMQTQLNNFDEKLSHDERDNYYNNDHNGSRVEEENNEGVDMKIANVEVYLLLKFIALLQQELISHAKCKLFMFALEQYNSNIIESSNNTKKRVVAKARSNKINYYNKIFNASFSMTHYALWKKVNKKLRIPLTDNIAITSPVLWQCLLQTNDAHINLIKSHTDIATTISGSNNHNGVKHENAESSNVDYMQWWRLHSECTQRMHSDESITLSTADVYLQRQFQEMAKTDGNYVSSTICGADWQILQPILTKMERYYNLMEIRFYYTQFNLERHHCKSAQSAATKSKTAKREIETATKEKWKSSAICENTKDATKSDLIDSDNKEEISVLSSERLLEKVCHDANESSSLSYKEEFVEMTAWEMWQETQFRLDAFLTHCFIHYYHASCFALLRAERQRQLVRVLKEIGVFIKRAITKNVLNEVKKEEKQQLPEPQQSPNTTNLVREQKEQEELQKQKIIRSNNDESEEWNSDEDDVIFGMTDDVNLHNINNNNNNNSSNNDNSYNNSNDALSDTVKNNDTKISVHASLEMANDKMSSDWQEYYKPLTKLLFANYNDRNVIRNKNNDNINVATLCKHHISVCNDMSLLLFTIHATLTLLERESKLTSTVTNRSTLFTSSSTSTPSVLEDSWQSLLWRVLVPLLSMYSLSQAGNSAFSNIFTAKEWLYQVKFVLWAMLECSLFALPWSEQGILTAMQKYTVVQEYWLNYHDRGLLESDGLEKLQIWLLYEEESEMISSNNRSDVDKTNKSTTPVVKDESTKDAEQENKYILPPSVDELELFWSPTMLRTNATHNNNWENTMWGREQNLLVHYPFPASLLFMQGVVKTISARFYQLQCAWERNRRGRINTNLLASSDNVNNIVMGVDNRTINSINNKSDDMNAHENDIVDIHESDNVDSANQLDYMLDVDALVEDELINDIGNNNYTDFDGDNNQEEEYYEEESIEQIEMYKESKVHSAFASSKSNQLRSVRAKQKEKSENLIFYEEEEEEEEEQLYNKRSNEHNTSTLEFYSFCTQSDIDVFSLLVSAVHRGCLAFVNSPTLTHTSALWEESRNEIYPERESNSFTSSQSCSLLQWWLAHLTHLFTFYVPPSATLSTHTQLYSIKQIERKLFKVHTRSRKECATKANKSHVSKDLHTKRTTKGQTLTDNDYKQSQAEISSTINTMNNKKCDNNLTNWFVMDVSSIFTSSHNALRIALGRELAHLALSSLTTMKSSSKRCNRQCDNCDYNDKNTNNTKSNYNNELSEETNEEEHESLESNEFNIRDSTLISCPIALPLLPESPSWVRYWNSMADEITLLQWTQLNDVLEGICLFTRITLFDTVRHGEVANKWKDEEEEKICYSAAHTRHLRRCRCQNVKRILHSFLGWDGFLSFAQQLHLHIVDDDNDDAISDTRLQRTLRTVYCAADDIWRML